MSRSGTVLQHFERDGALPGDDARVVVRMHLDVSLRSAADCLDARLRVARPSRRRSTTSAPCERVAATFTNGVVTGITMVAGMPSRAA